MVDAETYQKARAVIERVIACAAETQVITDEEERKAQWALGMFLREGARFAGKPEPKPDDRPSVPVRVAVARSESGALAIDWHRTIQLGGPWAAIEQLVGTTKRTVLVGRAYLPTEETVEAESEESDG